MDLSAVVRDLNEDPHRPRSFYEYPSLYDFFHSRTLDREAQVRLLRRFEPAGTDRVLEFGCGTGPLLARIEGEYGTVLGVDANGAMLDVAAERVTSAAVRRADFTEWSAADEGRSFDVTALFGGLLHLTEDRDVEAFAANARDSLRDGGAFVTFFEPLSEAVENGDEGTTTVESDRYTVERHSVSALTSARGHYTTTYCFVVRDEERGVEARMGTTVDGRFHDPDHLREIFSAAGFGTVEVIEGDGPTLLHAVR
jgi:SAM-dependent methyltransferase